MKKIFVALIIVSTFSLALPQKTQAQYIIMDPLNTTKEYGLDTIALIVAKGVLKRLTAQTVNWINSGFKGSPAYVTNPEQFFLNIADQTASEILSNTKLNALCSPFKAQVRLALVKNYLSDQGGNSSCTLSKVKNNFDAFTNDFSQGGWEGWFEVTQTSGGNPYSSYLASQAQLKASVDVAKSRYTKQLEQGRGFLSFETCPKNKQMTAAQAQKANLDYSWDGYKAGDCLLSTDKVVSTPGSVINDQLSDTLGSTWRQLEAADEINEVVTALVVQLVERVVGGIGNGLRGASDQGSGTGTGQSFTDMLRNERQPEPYDPGSATEPGDVVFRCRTDDDGIQTCSTGELPPDPDSLGPGTVNPSDEPASIAGSVASARSRYGTPMTPTEIGELLISVAAENSGAGWGVISKNSGNRCPSAVGSISCDILMHRPSCLIYDVLIDQETDATPAFNFAGGLPRSRWVSASGPAGPEPTAPCVTIIPPPEAVSNETPASLLLDLTLERAKYGDTMTPAELGKFLNAVAWKNRAKGWALLGKASGNNCPSPSGPLVSCDFLIHKPTLKGYDVLISQEAEAKPTWSGPEDLSDSVRSGSRTIVSPVQP